jgi:ankyrin repeat protein
MPLHLAVHNRHLEEVAILLKAKANIEARDKRGNTPLHYAVEMGQTELVKLLLVKNRADIAARNYNELTALHLATWKGHQAVVLLLLENGADFDTRDKIGWIALHGAGLERAQSDDAIALGAWIRGETRI